MKRIALRMLLRLALIAGLCFLGGCGTFRPEVATLRQVPGGSGYMLEITGVHRNMPNIHTFGLDTYLQTDLIMFDTIDTEVDGSNVKIVDRGGKHKPRGKLIFTTDRVTIRLQTSLWDSTGSKVTYSDYWLNGTYELVRQ
jgi:hypothetical protein